MCTQWVVTNKNGQIKARLVVRGLEEEYMMQCDSSSAGKETLRIYMFAALNNWTLKTTCVSSGQRNHETCLYETPKRK